MARVTKSYVTRAPRAGEASAIALCPSLRRRAVHDPRQIRDGGLGVELGMDVVAARVVREPGDERRLVVQIAEHDRLPRAGLSAGGPDIAVPPAPVLDTGPGLGSADA